MCLALLVGSPSLTTFSLQFQYFGNACIFVLEVFEQTWLDFLVCLTMFDLMEVCTYYLGMFHLNNPDLLDIKINSEQTLLTNSNKHLLERERQRVRERERAAGYSSRKL